MPRTPGPVVHSWGDQLGSRLRSKQIPRGLHACHCHQGMDIDIPPILKMHVFLQTITCAYLLEKLHIYFVYLLLFMPKFKLLILLELENIKH